MESLVFWILLYIWGAAEVLFILRAQFLKRGQAKKENSDRGSAFLIMVGMYILIYLSFYFSIWQWGMLQSGWQVAGYVLMIAGMVIRYSSILLLGRFFSAVVGVVKDQEIIQSGLYR